MKIPRRLGSATILPIIWIGILHRFSQVDAFRCYKCSSNEMPACVDEPSELPTSSAVECEGFCTIVRTEYTEIPGEVITLIRDCEDEPLVTNGVRTDKHYTHMYTSCDTELCNSGNGTREPGDEDNPGRIGPTNIIRVNESAGGAMIKSLWILIGGFSLLTFSVHKLGFH